MKFQIQRAPVTFTVTMSKMLLVISQVIRSWQNSRHLLMEPLLPTSPRINLPQRDWNQSCYIRVHVWKGCYWIWRKAVRTQLVSYKAHALLTRLFGSLEIFPLSNIYYFSSSSNILKAVLTTILKLLLTRHKKRNKNTHVVEAQVIKASFKHESLTLWIKDKKNL